MPLTVVPAQSPQGSASGEVLRARGPAWRDLSSGGVVVQKQGADMHIGKPFADTDIQEAIRRYVR